MTRTELHSLAAKMLTVKAALNVTERQEIFRALTEAASRAEDTEAKTCGTCVHFVNDTDYGTSYCRMLGVPNNIDKPYVMFECRKEYETCGMWEAEK